MYVCSWWWVIMIHCSKYRIKGVVITKSANAVRTTLMFLHNGRIRHIKFNDLGLLAKRWRNIKNNHAGVTRIELFAKIEKHVIENFIENELSRSHGNLSSLNIDPTEFEIVKYRLHYHPYMNDDDKLYDYN